MDTPLKYSAPARRAAAALLLAALASGCVPVKPPAPGVDPRGAPITTAQIRSAMHDTRQTLYAIGLGLVGGAAGTIIGGKIGYEIGYAHDIRAGCEDCGLGGLLAGAAAGMVTGMVAGGNVGMHAGARADRDDALARIIRERARQTSLGLTPACRTTGNVDTHRNGDSDDPPPAPASRRRPARFAVPDQWLPSVGIRDGVGDVAEHPTPAVRPGPDGGWTPDDDPSATGGRRLTYGSCRLDRPRPSQSAAYDHIRVSVGRDSPSAYR